MFPPTVSLEIFTHLETPMVLIILPNNVVDDLRRREYVSSVSMLSPSLIVFLVLFFHCVTKFCLFAVVHVFSFVSNTSLKPKLAYSETLISNDTEN